MDAHLQYPTVINHLQPPVKSSVAHAYSVESSCQGRQVSQYQGESPGLKVDKPGSGTSTWSFIKSIPRNISKFFEIKKGEESLVAKVVPDWKANDLAAGLKSIRMLLFFMPKEIRMAIREMTNPLIRQCNLKEEKKNQAAFKEALEQTVRLDTLLPQATKLTFRVPKITEAVDADNLLIMEHLQDGHALNTLINPENQQLRSEVYQRCFGVNLVDDDLFKSVLDKVHFQVQEKWCELALGHGIVHGDCHPDNIMLSFKPDGHIDVWFNDFGNCITLTEAQRTQYPDTAHLLSNLADPFTPEAMDQTRLDRLVDTLSWINGIVGYQKEAVNDLSLSGTADEHP